MEIQESNMTTDTTEKGLETIITNALIDHGWLPSTNEDYQRNHCVDLNHLRNSWKPPSPTPQPASPWTPIPPPSGSFSTESRAR